MKTIKFDCQPICAVSHSEEAGRLQNGMQDHASIKTSHAY
jgi:hypothetical protein